MDARSITSLARVALSAATREELRRHTLDALQSLVGFDFGIVWRPDEAEATLDGFDRRFFRLYQARQAAYADDLAALVTAACAQRDVTSDVEAIGARQRMRSAFYAEIIRPVGSATFLTAVMRLRGRVVGMMQLGRARGFAFKEREANRLRELVPIVALAEASHPAVTPSERSARLSPRESELLRYLTLGLTNREIALACDTSPNTVRNQLVSLFRKAGVSTRAELVAWSLGALR